MAWQKDLDADWNVAVEVSKNATTDYQVDAISGATITSNGVTAMLQFWLGEYGFGPYLKQISASPPKTSTDVESDPGESA